MLVGEVDAGFSACDREQVGNFELTRPWVTNYRRLFPLHSDGWTQDTVQLLQTGGSFLAAFSEVGTAGVD